MAAAGTYNAIAATAVGRWDLQDDAASTTVVATVGSNGTLQGGSNTSAVTVAGPNTWLPKALDFDGSSRYINGLGNGITGTGARSYLFWAKPDEIGTERRAITQGTGNGGGTLFHLTCESGLRLRHGGGNITYGTGSTEWRHYALSVGASETTDDAVGYINGSAVGSSRTGGSNQTLNVGAGFTIGADHAGNLYFDGALAGVLQFNTELSAGDVAAVYSGPEPLNLTAGSITGTTDVGSTLTAVAGTWNDRSNGTGTSAFSWYVNNVLEDTGSTFDTTGLSPGDEVHFIERRTNDGGYDSDEDTQSSNTITLTGGGSTPVPAILHHRRLMSA